MLKVLQPKTMTENVECFTKICNIHESKQSRANCQQPYHAAPPIINVFCVSGLEAKMKALQELCLLLAWIQQISRFNIWMKQTDLSHCVALNPWSHESSRIPDTNTCPHSCPLLTEDMKDFTCNPAIISHFFDSLKLNPNRRALKWTYHAIFE